MSEVTLHGLNDTQIVAILEHVRYPMSPSYEQARQMAEEFMGTEQDSPADYIELHGLCPERIAAAMLDLLDGGESPDADRFIAAYQEAQRERAGRAMRESMPVYEPDVDGSYSAYLVANNID